MQGECSIFTRTFFAIVMCLAAGCLSGEKNKPLNLTAALKPDRLRCEYRNNPQGIDAPAPRLGWIVASGENGQKQTAYRVLVATSAVLLDAREGDCWDTGKVLSDQTCQIAYGGKPLQSGRRYYWKVQVWDRDGKPSSWSRTAHWDMGLLDKSDWRAQWISFKDTADFSATQKKMELPPARFYRKPFKVAGPVRRATVYASALGIYDFRVNGRCATDALFTPGWSDYKKRAYYNTFDITNLLQDGDNAMGAIVADGWYSGYLGYGLLVGYGPAKSGRAIYGKTPALLAQVVIEYQNGQSETIVTDPSWTVSTGPFLEADMLMGERYDARLAMPGWDRAGFDDARWQRAVLAKDNPPCRATFHDKGGQRPVDLHFTEPPVLQAYSTEPIRCTQTLKPVAMTEPSPGVYIFNMGQNFSGVVRLSVKGKAGTEIKLRYGEMLHPDGRLMTENLRKARATDHYILSGRPEGETYQPTFTYHGFQYVEVTGLPAKPTLDTITGVVIHSDTPLTSSFECSDPTVNQLFSNVVWTQRANFFEVPTDCPQRDERFGWTGDAQIYCRTATYNADVAAFFTKWLDDLDESQLPNGAFPDYAPYPMMHGKPRRGFATAWTDAGIICPYTIYRVYGDTRVIKRHYPAMKRFMEFRRKRSPDYLGVNTGNGWGDWLSLGSKTPIEYIDTVYFAYSAGLMAEMAKAIGKDADAADYKALKAAVTKAFQAKYVKPDGTLAVDNQTAYVLALSVGLMPDKLKSKAQARLVALIQQNKNAMTTGFLGTKPLLPVLTRAGLNDLAVALFQSRQFPSWCYEVINGATSIWERWNSYTKDKGFGNAAMNSFSHYAFGAVCQWMFQDLAGIDTREPGFQTLVIRPRPPSPAQLAKPSPLSGGQPVIHWVKATYDSIRGPVKVAWRQTPVKFSLDVTIPANTRAAVHLPGPDGRKIHVDSGSHHFEVKH